MGEIEVLIPDSLVSVLPQDQFAELADVLKGGTFTLEHLVTLLGLRVRGGTISYWRDLAWGGLAVRVDAEVDKPELFGYPLPYRSVR